MALAYLLLGSNLGDRVGFIQQAIRMLCDHPAIELDEASSLYETEPVGYADQDWFVNAAVALRTNIRAAELLSHCQSIETQLDRLRDPENQNAPRTIDIDILFYDRDIINEPNLIVPHPRLHQRAFALVPMLELAHDFVHPQLGKTLEVLHQELDSPEEVLLFGTRSQF